MSTVGRPTSTITFGMVFSTTWLGFYPKKKNNNNEKEEFSHSLQVVFSIVDRSQFEI
jgi:hypothetical protein